MHFRLLWRGMRPLLGTVIGVGIFGLPYAFANIGFGLGFLALGVVGFLSLMALLLYADLVLVRKDHGRYLSIVGHDLSLFERVFAAIAYFGSHYGALLAYVIVGGAFAHALLSPMIGGSLLLFQVIFWLIGSLVAVGGLSFLVRLQGILFPLILLLVIILAVFLAPQISMPNLGTYHPENAILSLGVFLFAFGGLSAVPDMRDVLHRNRAILRTSLIVGMLVVAMFYAFFAFLVVGVTGGNTAPEALTGIAPFLGPFALALGSLLGLGVVMSAYLTVSVSMTNALFYDWRLRVLPSWALVISVPILLILLGATNFISVIGITGGILGSFLGFFLVIAYERARRSHELPKNSLNIPQWLVAMTFLMYTGMIVLTVARLLG